MKNELSNEEEKRKVYLQIKALLSKKNELAKEKAAHTYLANRGSDEKALDKVSRNIALEKDKEIDKINMKISELQESIQDWREERFYENLE